MADIKGRTLAATYRKLLYTADDDGLEGNTSATTSVITTDDGDGTSTASCLNLGIDRIGIGTSAPGQLLHIKSTSASTTVMIETSNNGSDATLALKSSDNQWNINSKEGGTFDIADEGTSVRMTIDGAGQVGIGIEAPEALLHLNVTGSVIAPATGSLLVLEDTSGPCGINILTGKTATDDPFISFGDEDAAEQVKIYYEHDQSPELLHFEIGGQDRMVLTNAGNVGIGTAAPREEFHVYDSATTATSGNLLIQGNHNSEEVGNHQSGLLFKIDSADDDNKKKAGIFLKRTGWYGVGDMHFALENTASEDNVDLSTDTKMIIKGSGQVGIGITAPAQALDVKGSLRIEDDASTDTAIL
ncbi:MAG: hypothetical protein CMI54_02005, partial [Parcubacteria group bacterium]|nr:hypothetical protein [Parcubacteria group bacterium]